MLSEDSRNRAKYSLIRAIPDRFAPEDLKGRLLVNAYLNGDGAGSSYFRDKILSIPGTRGSILKYLSGAGSSKLPELVGKHLGAKWYTGPAKLLSRAPIVKGIVLDKISDKIMPELHGSKEIAKYFNAYGGMV